MRQFAQEFRETNFDDWDRTYEQVKNGMYHWKSTRFTPLESGDSIYESACGIGLNLYMTLEILQETRNITHLVVYGNEYLKISADKANAVMEQIAPAEATKGVICPGDSTDLPFVPSNAFDLVYTGYLRYVRWCKRVLRVSRERRPAVVHEQHQATHISRLYSIVRVRAQAPFWIHCIWA